MNGLAYSSLEAFLAHWRALCAAAEGRLPPTPGDLDKLNVMNGIVGDLSREERELLLTPSRGARGAAGRRRQRAELKLRRILTSRGILRD
jgi:hypothetical protein